MGPEFERVKRYYDLKVWNDARVRLAVNKRWITESDYTEITGALFSE